MDANGNLYVTLSFGWAYCYDGQNGNVLWSYHNNDGSGLGEPVVAAYAFTFIPTTRGVVAINSATGGVAWTWSDVSSRVALCLT